MAEIRHYLLPDLYVPIRTTYQKAKRMIQELLEDMDDAHFDRQENGTVIYVRKEAARRVFVVVRKRENTRLLRWLNHLGY